MKLIFGIFRAPGLNPLPSLLSNWDQKPRSSNFLPPESLIMSAIFRSSYRNIRSYSNLFTRRLWCRHSSPSRSTIISKSLFTRPFVSAANPKSPLDAIALRVLRNEIEYQSNYAPPHQVHRLFSLPSLDPFPCPTFCNLQLRTFALTFCCVIL